MRLRVRLRSLLVLVALAAVVLAGLARASRWREELEWRRRTVLYRGLARTHEMQADAAYKRWRWAYVNHIYGEQERYAWPTREGRAAVDRRLIKLEQQAATQGRSALYHAALQDKYTRAAEQPWAPLEPDPPPP